MSTLGKNRKKHPFFYLLKLVLKLRYHRHAVEGADHVQKGAPAVFICNHMESYAPIVMELYFPFEFRPWAIGDNFTPELCRDYIEDDFIKKELRLRPPYSRWLASAIAPLCVLVMKSAEAIPVFRGKLRMRIKETFEMSMEAVRRGGNLVIFPENPERRFSEFLYDFHPGFVRLAKLYYDETGKTLYFYPVFVGKAKRVITIGRPVGFSPENDFSSEKEYIREYLRDSVNEIAHEQNIRISSS